MDEANIPELVMSPKEAARRLGVAASTLRRFAPTYEAVHGSLPWEGDDAGGGRLWPSTAVERVAAARALVAEGRAKSLESALRALEGGAPPPSGVLSRPDGVVELAEVLRSELEDVRRGLDEIPALREEIAALRSELAAARALPVEAGVEAVNRLEPQRPEQESWVKEWMLQALIEASELPAAAREGREGNQSTGEAPGAAEGSSDGPMVRAARWLEGLLRR